MNDGTVYSGQEWLDAFMQAQASLQAQQFFLLFSLGQLGAIAEHAPERAIEIVECVENDINDLEKAAERLARTAFDITANLRRNITVEASS